MEIHTLLDQFDRDDRAQWRRRRREELTPNVFLLPLALVERWLAHLPGDAVKVYCYLASLVLRATAGPAEADVEEIADRCGLSVPEALRALQPLLLAGLVTAEVTLPGDRALYATTGG